MPSFRGPQISEFQFLIKYSVSSNKARKPVLEQAENSFGDNQLCPQEPMKLKVTTRSRKKVNFAGLRKISSRKMLRLRQKIRMLLVNVIRREYNRSEKLPRLCVGSHVHSDAGTENEKIVIAWKVFRNGGKTHTDAPVFMVMRLFGDTWRAVLLFLNS